MHVARLMTLVATLSFAGCERRGSAAGDTARTSANTTAPSRRVIDSLFARFAAPGMPGASVLVVRHDSVLLRASFGLADVEGKLAATPATNYRLASLTKQFTATAILLLARDGKLSIDAPVRDFLPELPAYARDVTIRHLLTHTSGLWDYEAFVPDTQQRQVHDLDALALVRAHAESLYFAPGTSWRYSNTGYALLALIVERVSGERFGDVLRARVFVPLGMHDTYAHEEGRTQVPRRAWGYTVHRDTVARTDQSNTSAVLGDGGVYSSIDDLARWHASLSHAPIVGDSAWRASTTPFVLRDGTATEYGFGWFIEQYKGRRRLRHHGETRGFTNWVARYPDDGVTIIVLTNRTDSAPWDLADALADRYLSP
ncbi:MAG TPA: serine hydrolase domain-containing protein [Gemmatimonadaceae bacterium]|nr:serine hydrolase domain-containing protein [Gemmatimonadaceae bacterium]